MSVPSNGGQKSVNVVGFPASHTLTPAQALGPAGQMDLKQALVVGYGREGLFTLRPGRMSRAGALWLLEAARYWVFPPEE